MALTRISDETRKAFSQAMGETQAIFDEIESVLAPGGGSGLGDPGANGVIFRTALGVTDAVPAGAGWLHNNGSDVFVYSAPSKTDVGLGNVDNTSDATKNSAVATLTNKTLTAPVINSPTGIVKGDVGLGNVSNNLQLTVANNLSDLASAATARTNLGVAIGSNVQAWDADLDAIAAIAGTSGLLKKTAANTWSLDTSTYATQAYADALVVGLLDDRGNYNASGNAFPSSGGSGAAGAILKGDLWTISVAGTLGGHPVTPGDVVRALVDSPGSTDANWAIGENNFGYVALNQALADGKIYVGNGSGIGTAVTPSGDVTISNAGVTAIGALKVTNAMLAGSIAVSKLDGSTTTTNALLKSNGTNLVASRIADDGTDITIDSVAGTTTLGDVFGLANGTTLKIRNDGAVTLGGAGVFFPDTAAAYSLGYGPKPFSSLFIGAAATNNIQITGTTTAARVATFPDANTKIPISAQVLTFSGPTAARTWTAPDANFSLARIDAAQTFVGTQTYAGNQVPSATDTYDLGTALLLWRKGWLSELDAVLFAQNTISVVGGWMMIAKNEGLIPVGQDVATGNTTIDFGQAMTANDFVIFRAAGAVEYVQVLTVSSGTRYNVTRDLDGSGANAWPAGSVYVVLGNTTSGRIELNSNSTPRISMVVQGATYNAQTEMLRMGDLNGNWGIGSETYGFASGQYGASGKSWFSVDPTNGVRLGSNTTTRVSLAADGSGYVANSLIAWDTSGNLTITGNAVIGGVTIGSGKMYIGTGTYNNTNTSFYVDSTGQFSLKDKLVWSGSALTISGTVTATAGTIGGWTLGATSLSAGSGATTVAMDSGGTNPAFYAGSATPGSAPFRVTNAGALTATNATITGAITATSGSITGTLTMSGSDSAIAIGTTPPVSSTSGTGVWIDRTGLYGVASSVAKFMLDATDGILKLAVPSTTGSNALLQFNLTTGAKPTSTTVIGIGTTYDSGAFTGASWINTTSTFGWEIQKSGVAVAGFSTNSYITGDLTVSGLLKTGSGPTTLTDSAGKILSAALNTVAVANGGTGTTTAFTPGSVVFAGASGVYAQNNAKLFWDDTNNRLGLGTASPGLVSGSSSAFFEISGATNPGFALRNTTGTKQYFFYVGSTGSNQFSIFDATATVDRLLISNTGVVTISDLAGTGSRNVVASASGVLSAPVSDARLKTNVRSISSEMDVIAKLEDLRGVYFDFIETDGVALTQDRRRQIGMIADEVEAVFPEIVGFNNPVNGKAYRYLNLEKMVAFLVEVAKVQQLEINQLRSR